MSSELNSLYESTAFRRLAPAKAKLIREMVDMMENKSTNEKMQIMISYGFRMKNNGLTLTSEESSLLLNALQQNLSPQERQKMQTLLQMF